MPKAVVIGSGGREHALVEALLASPSKPRVESVPGNPGMPPEVRLVPASGADLDALEAASVDADLVVIGPEAPLVAGLADRLRARSIPVLGPSAAAARLEGSKVFAKALMTQVGVPTARWGEFTAPEAARAFARTLPGGVVVKADGLAAGKGVVVAEDLAEADRAIESYLVHGDRGEAGRTLVVEERLVGEELSLIGLCDGRHLRLFPAARDHKRIGEGDTGPNTGGMGAYAPTPLATDAVIEKIVTRCMQPVVDALADAGTPLVGVLYAGIMMTADGPRVLEYNVRFGDPETQVILPLVTEDLYLRFRDAAMGRLEPGRLETRPGSAVTVVLASAGYPATARSGDRIEGLEAAARRDDLRVFHAGTALADDGSVITAGGRVLALTGLGPSLEAAVEIAYAGVDLVRFDGRQYRADIGVSAIRASGPGGPSPA